MAETFSYARFLEELRRDAAAVPEAVRTIRRTVRLHGPRLFQEEVDGIVPPPVDRGTYRRSIHVDDVDGGCVFYNSAPHAAIVEEGRRPGARMPPLRVIEDWVRRKGLVSRGRGRGARARFDSDVRSAAYLVARAIKRRGLPAQHILRLAGRRLDKIVRDALRALGPGAPA